MRIDHRIQNSQRKQLNSAIYSSTGDSLDTGQLDRWRFYTKSAHKIARSDLSFSPSAQGAAVLVGWFLRFPAGSGSGSGSGTKWEQPKQQSFSLS